MSTIGAEMEQLQSLRTKFQSEAGTVQQLTASIGGQVGETWWQGPAADRFRAAWEQEFAPALNHLHAALTDAGTEIQRRHEALQAAGS